MTRPHAVLIPFPFPGHINPTLRLAQVLHLRGFFITFVNTEFSHGRFLDAHGTDAMRGCEGFRFETIPDGLLPSDCTDAVDYDRLLISSIQTNYFSAPLRELILRLNSTAGIPRVSCLIPSGLMSFALDVARELGIKSLILWGASACGFMGSRMLRELVQRGYTPLDDESYLTNGFLGTIIDWIPGMPGIQLGDVSSFTRTTKQNMNYSLKFSEEEANNCTKAWGLILDTFDHLEPDVLDALRCTFPRMYTLGPLPVLLSETSTTSLSLWNEDSGCISWLDTQRAASVLYVSFGSFRVLTPQQLVEFAWGLAESRHPFLWIVRPCLVTGGLGALPPDFIQETKDRCFIASWCAQKQVLNHPAIAGFLTHSGWNSTIESISAGVPMICWPGFADQHTNSRYTCKEWGIGLQIDDEVRRQQVRELVEELMEGEKGKEMRINATKWKGKAEEATKLGGSSYENLQRMIGDLSQDGMLHKGPPFLDP